MSLCPYVPVLNGGSRGLQASESAHRQTRGFSPGEKPSDKILQNLAPFRPNRYVTPNTNPLGFSEWFWFVAKLWNPGKKS